MTFEQAVGRIFEFSSPTEGRRQFYVTKGYRRPWNTCYEISTPQPEDRDFGKQHVLVGTWRGEIDYQALVIDLETHKEVVIYNSRFSDSIPQGWKEILP